MSDWKTNSGVNPWKLFQWEPPIWHFPRKSFSPFMYYACLSVSRLMGLIWVPEWSLSEKTCMCVYRFGDHYEWNKVTSCIHNILSGQRWIEHYGEMSIKNVNSDACQCKITFVKVRKNRILVQFNHYVCYGDLCLNYELQKWILFFIIKFYPTFTLYLSSPISICGCLSLTIL